MPIRFPNNSSDIARLVNSYRLIHLSSKAQGVDVFDLDFMTQVLTDELQVSSRGAVGQVARERSRTDDRSRDPLYNQLKMYSEVFRFLGWLRPSPKSRLSFSTTLLGDAMAEDLWQHQNLRNGLLRECFLAVAFPNPLLKNVGVVNQRPFRWFLCLAQALGGSITRNELILAGLAVVDDRAPDAFDSAVETVRRIRGGSPRVATDALETYAAAVGVQANTLKNYTRVPLGVLQDPIVGWGDKVNTSDIYDKPVDSRRLTALGHAAAEWLNAARDVREADLEPFSLDERAHFANYSYYAMLLRSGVDPGEVRDYLHEAATGCRAVLNGLEIADPTELLYSPFQQASDEVITRALELP